MRGLMGINGGGRVLYLPDYAARPVVGAVLVLPTSQGARWYHVTGGNAFGANLALCTPAQVQDIEARLATQHRAHVWMRAFLNLAGAIEGAAFLAASGVVPPVGDA